MINLKPGLSLRAAAAGRPQQAATVTDVWHRVLVFLILSSGGGRMAAQQDKLLVQTAKNQQLCSRRKVNPYSKSSLRPGPASRTVSESGWRIET